MPGPWSVPALTGRGSAWALVGLEGRLGAGGCGRERVVDLGRRRGAAEAAAVAAVLAGRGAGHVRRRVAQARTDVVGLDLDRRAGLAVLGLPVTDAEAAGHDHR